ncbi:hypothetical protein IAU60_005307 [Kwoniella sp. DSM 27419]
MYIPSTPHQVVPRDFGFSNGGGLRAPLRVIIPVFGVFGGVVLLAVVGPLLRRCYVQEQFRSAVSQTTRQTTVTSRQQGFEIDSPRVTPFPRPATPSDRSSTDRLGTPTAASSTSRPFAFSSYPRLPEPAITRSAALGDQVIQVVPPAYSFASPRVQDERPIRSTSSRPLGGLNRPMHDLHSFRPNETAQNYDAHSIAESLPAYGKVPLAPPRYETLPGTEPMPTPWRTR